MLIAKTAQMRAIEQAAIEEQGITLYELMERAGAAVATEARRMAPKPGPVVIFCGKGNNGGDGYVAARLLAKSGYSVDLVMLVASDELDGAAAEAFTRIAGDNTITKRRFDARRRTANAALIIDALLGFGLRGAVRGTAAKAIGAINDSPTPVLAVDIPSGVDSDTGLALGPVVAAERTITFTAPKAGMALWPGCELSGEIRVADIGISKDIVVRHTNICLGGKALARPLLPSREAGAHKGDCGSVLVVAGSVGMTGAAALTAGAAVRIGAGLVRLGVPESLNDILEAKLTEVITIPLPETIARSARAKAFDTLMELIPEADALVVGPGMSNNESTTTLIRQLVIGVKGPLVIDADGLNALVGKTELLTKRQGETLLTPHPGELARLLNVSIAEIQADRLGAAQTAVERWGVTLVLKGARTVIGGGGCFHINPTGNAGMATAGSGDVLAGMLGGLLGQGLPAYPAAVLGAYLHGRAGDLGAVALSELALRAGDLLDYLPAAILELQGGGAESKDGGD